MKGYNLLLLLVSLSLISIQKGKAGRLFNQDNDTSTSTPQYSPSTSSGSQPNFPVSQGPTIADCYAKAKTPSDVLKCQKTLLSCIKGGTPSLQCMARANNGQSNTTPLSTGTPPLQQYVVDPSSSNNNNNGIGNNTNNPIERTIVGPIGPKGAGSNQTLGQMAGNRASGGILGSGRGRLQGMGESEKSGGLGAER
jgi:hypothetical protein